MTFADALELAAHLDGLADRYALDAKEESKRTADGSFERGMSCAYRSAASYAHTVVAPEDMTRRQKRTYTGNHAHDLAQLAAERARIEATTTKTVQAAREAGQSWQTIGDALGISKQAAQQRYGAKPAPKPDPGQLTLTD